MSKQNFIEEKGYLKISVFKKQDSTVCVLFYKPDRVCFIFSAAGKFSLALGLRQLTRNVKSDVRNLKFRGDVTFAPPRKTPKGVRKESLCDVKCLALSVYPRVGISLFELDTDDRLYLSSSPRKASIFCLWPCFILLYIFGK